MTAFRKFLCERIDGGGFTTEDVLTSFLPLMRQVIDTHKAGHVAPLDGTDKLHVEHSRIWYGEADQQPPRSNLAAVRKLLGATPTGVEVVRERRLTFDVADGVEEDRDLNAGEPDEKLRPAYMPGFVCWEHQAEHHDPASDVFSLGLILASLACGLDLSEPRDHERFVAERRNLFRINPDLHPVIARAIVLMTELDRHQRPQDLAALLATLENYRDQAVDFETDLASDQRLQGSDGSGKRQVVLSKLQERLFEINRRNRLLHFRSTMQTVNLTHASIPLSFDVEKIRPDQVLTWDGSFREQILKQKPVSLNKFLNFREAVYLPGTLDRIRSEARRDVTEYGFAQLRLIICFLRWADLKAKPPERYESPLLLVPVKLDVKKGITDRYSLTAVDSVAEVNPVVRHLFKQLYDIDLPDQVSLQKDGVTEFFEDLKQRIESSDASVELARVDRPRIELIHEKARRKLDQFRRRARLSGRGIRHFMDLDYSYDPINYHPLGIRLFENFITPARTHLEGVVSTRPPKRRYMVADASDEADNVVEAEKSFYSLKSEADDNPFHWEFDLCSVTLANLKYRRMSLVRDYARLVSEDIDNAAFEATFSINPTDRPVEPEPSSPLEERFHVVPCDPTQGNAITHARSRKSYIIQGPPGTGKSQTITNLIADYVIRGGRVLFVCEKRAAIDVVYHRLKQLKLHELCCLIHDSQADKRQFVMELKECYQAFLDEAAHPRNVLHTERDELLEQLKKLLEPVADFNEAMNNVSEPSGVRLRELLNRLIELRQSIPTLGPAEWERVPWYAAFVNSRSEVAQFVKRLELSQPDGVLLHHPLCLLKADMADAERPVEAVTASLTLCLGEEQADSETDGRVDELMRDVDRLKLPETTTQTLEHLKEAVAFAQRASFLAECNLFSLLDDKSETATLYGRRFGELARRKKWLANARGATEKWRQKFSPEDTKIALDQATRLESSPLRLVNPAWWRLRGVMHRSYDFSGHAVRPSFTQVLGSLVHEYDKQSEYDEMVDAIRSEFGVPDDLETFNTQLTQLHEDLDTPSDAVRDLYRHLLQRSDGDEVLQRLARMEEVLVEVGESLDRILEDYQHLSLEDLRGSLVRLRDSISALPDYLHCLSALKQLPRSIQLAVRRLPLTLIELEAAAAERTLQDAYRGDPELARYNGEARARQIQEVAKVCDQWLKANAATIREHVRQRFNDHVNVASKPAAQLEPEQKEFKKQFNRGRRELEHEFGKSMRYKAIRELAAGDSGLVIRDLKPVWLMSPLSVSDTLPLNSDHFDVVIFDEASQITLEEAIPSLFRADQTIVVGDEMQLPPTSFFSTKRDDDEDGLSFEEQGEVIEYDLNSSSFLNHSSRNLPTRMLGWHYRSRSESLISFSNHAFYGGRLLTVPEEQLSTDQRSELIAESAEDARAFATELLSRPVSFHLMEHGVYEKRRNAAEAEYIAELVRTLLMDETSYSIGIVAFSEAQQGEIERAIRSLADEDKDFSELLDAELEREEDGQFMGLILKNLENIQGDERDIIIMSVCYGPDSEGRTRMNFGPINMSGGEKRLNVAFSRAKHFMALVASMRSTSITNDYNDGANCLKSYLKYAEVCSAGQSSSAATLLRGLSGRIGLTQVEKSESDPLIDEIADALVDQGFTVDRDVGQSHFRCDLAVYREGDPQYRLGILTDSSRWYAQDDLLERELMKPQLLRAFGWRITIVLARDWYHDRDRVVTRLKQDASGSSA